LRGNPIFDVVYTSFKKFGPHSRFIGAPSETVIHLLTDKNLEKNVETAKNYFKKLKLKDVSTKI